MVMTILINIYTNYFLPFFIIVLCKKHAKFFYNKVISFPVFILYILNEGNDVLFNIFIQQFFAVYREH